MQRQRIRTEAGSQALYIGIDVHARSWQVSIFSTTREHKTFTQPPNSQALVRYVRKHFPQSHAVCAYEAGFSGFRLARELDAHGLACLVVNPADIPTTHKDKMHKNDRIDSRRLARELRSGSLRSVYVPPVDAVEDRALLRQRRHLVVKLTRCKTQIRMHLYNVGQDLPADVVSRHWPARMITWLEGLELETPSGTKTLRSLLRELAFLRTEHLEVTRQVRQLARTERYAHRVNLLLTVPGIGVVTAMTLLTELVDMARFPTSDALASYVGLIPREASSGAKISTPGMTTRRNASLRQLLIEAAWTASKRDPALLAIYEKAARRMAKSKAIVLVARRLLNRIRVVLETETPYEMGRRKGTWTKERALEWRERQRTVRKKANE